MHVSEQYHLGVDQGGLDFVDVDTSGDVPVFIDPKAIRLQVGPFAEECQTLLQTYFSELLTAIGATDTDRIGQLIQFLGSEPNETHLGLSQGNAQGRGLGPKQRQALVKALARSKAARTGLLQDLEETVLFVPGVGRDTISDMTTSVIRWPLIDYTQQMCSFYGIPMVPQWSGLAWDKATLEWVDGTVDLPRASADKLLLVPKSIVRLRPIVDSAAYYRGFIRPYLIEEETQAGSELIQTLKGGRKKPHLTRIDQKHGTDKPAVEKHTEKYPRALDEYRRSITPATSPPLDHDTLQEVLGAPKVDYDELFEAVKAIAPGHGGASSYHRAAAALLTSLFDASLGNEAIESSLHNGRKRVDIAYDNIAPHGFFHWLGQHHLASMIVVECKNYTGDPANPELDQLANRFSNNRGRIGLLVCRSFNDKALFEQRCRDTASDGNGFIIPLDDDDLAALVSWAKTAEGKTRNERAAFPLLRERFGRLIGQ